MSSTNNPQTQEGGEQPQQKNELSQNQNQQSQHQSQQPRQQSATDKETPLNNSGLNNGTQEPQQSPKEQQQYQEQKLQQQDQQHANQKNGNVVTYQTNETGNNNFDDENMIDPQNTQNYGGENSLGYVGGIERSLWLAKKAHHDTDKNINLLMNRLALLKKEEEKSQKKIQDTRDKTKKILEAKKRNEDMNQKKNFNRQHDDEFLQLMQKKSHELRKQQEEERKAIRKAIEDQKKEEYFEIKRQQHENERRIKIAKQKQEDQKRKKHDRVNSIIENSRKNIESYWQQRLKFFEDQQDNDRQQHLSLKSNKERLLEKLEEQEAQIIKRLQYSQEVHEKACRELDEVIQLPASHFLKKQNQLSGSMPSLNNPKNSRYQ